MNNNGIILAGGSGTRMHPATTYINKHLLPVYNKPMIFYSLSILIYAGIKNILLISSKEYIYNFEKLLTPVAKRNKIKITYKIQENLKGGIAESLIIGKDFIKKSNKTILILGDNFFYGRAMPQILRQTLSKKSTKAHIFLCPVKNPKDFGIAYVKKNKIIRIIEKPKNNINNLAVTGIYIYNKKHLKYCNRLSRSNRGELEITSLNNICLKKNELTYTYLGRGITWFDMGTYENLFECSEFIRLIENKQGLKIADI
jgi:glucose-1-phosphate thymidylyltransferase